MQTRTWGPFTGRQLTTMFCVTIVTLLLPVAAWSAAASHVIVDTPVAANVAQRTQFIASGNFKTLPTNNTPLALITPPAGKGLVITSFHAGWNDSNAASFLHMFVGNQTTCAAEQLTYEWELGGATNGNIDAPITPGYVVPPGKSLCAHSGGGIVGAYVNADGYIVAPGTVSTPHVDAAVTPHSARP